MTITGPRLLIALARSHRALAAAVEGSIAQLGLCLSDFMLLEALLHKGPLTISDIQEKVLLASGSMTAAVDRLEDKGLLRRKSVEGDRRMRMIELTPKGARTAQSAYDKHAADLEDLLSVLDDSEKERLYSALKKIRRASGKETRNVGNSKK